MHMIAATAAFTPVAIRSASAKVRGDATLAQMVDELEGIAWFQRDVGRSHPGLDCEDIPGFAQSEDRRGELLDLIEEIEAEGISGLQSKARALLLKTVADDFERTASLTASLAIDILRVHPIGGLT